MNRSAELTPGLRASRAWVWFHRLGSPPYFYALSNRLLPWCAGLTALLFAIGLIWGLIFAPADYQQGDSFRIIYVHVPAAALSLSIYVTMAISGAVGLIWRIKLAHMVASACAPVGAAYTFLSLVTGALWGKPMWGTYWVWDARLTSQLILLFLYLGYIALRQAMEDRERAARAAAILALVGTVNIPIIKYSVEWWHTLHQGATLFKFDAPSITPDMLWPLLVMLAAYFVFFVTVTLLNTRNEILERQLEQAVIREQRPGERP